MREVVVVIEHAAWLGPDYKLSINQQRVAIVGYSHWREEGDEDTVEATRECLRQVISGEWNIQFFNQIRNYFFYEDHGTFWRRVMFFNFLPNCVLRSEKFKRGTDEQITCAQDRFLRLIREQLPDKVLIFTARHWAFPRTDSVRQQLGSFPKFSWGTYRVDDHTAKAFFLRHPQGASGELMRGAVKYVLDEPNLEGNAN
jgi:hypothetical protein